ncbi:MAG TPA: hypothetical protein VII66_10745 [Gemmatimonadaceae bacterium]
MNHSLRCCIPATGIHRAVRFALRAASVAATSLGVAALLLNAACYTYDARSPAEILPGQHVVVTVNNTGRVALSADLGDDVAHAEGDLISADATGIHMRVTEVEYLSGLSSQMAGVQVIVPSNSVVLVTAKQFSRSKTAVAVGGLGALLIAAIKAFGLTGGGNGDAGSKPASPPGTT